MKAALLRNFELVTADIESPTPGPSQVLVRTLACGICGSDLHFVEHARSLWERQRVGDESREDNTFQVDLERDVVLGHEFCAEIVAFGDDCRQELNPGTRICAMPIGAHAGVPHTVGFSNELPGAYGELMVLEESLLLPVPDGISSELAALTEPMAVGRHAVETARLHDDAVRLVVGCGPIGLAVVGVLAMKGLGPIFASDPSPARRALAKAFGADVVIDPKEESPYVAWASAAVRPEPAPAVFDFFPQMPSLRPTVIFECVGAPGVLQQILEGALRHTKVIVVGVCMEDDNLRPGVAINKELDLQFVLGYTPEEFTETLQDLASGRLVAEPMLTGRTGIDGVTEAFAALRSPEQHAKIVIEPERSGGVVPY